jgi:hypothetical protein
LANIDGLNSTFQLSLKLTRIDTTRGLVILMARLSTLDWHLPTFPELSVPGRNMKRL